MKMKWSEYLKEHGKEEYELDHQAARNRLQEWLASDGFKVYCELKHGPVGEVLALLADGCITRARAAEAVAELLVGRTPVLPEDRTSVLAEDECAGDVITNLRDELKRIGDKVSLAVACDNPSVEALVDQLIYNYDQVRKGPACAYCGARESDITEHIMSCPHRPEMKLILILGSFAEAANQCFGNYEAQDLHQLRAQVKYFMEKTYGPQFLETAKSWIDRALTAEAELAALKTMASAGPEDCDKANQ